MVSKVKPKDLDVAIKFGGGLHTRASEDQIDPGEASDGTNFILDIENTNLRNRKPFDLIGTLPNNGAVLGGGSLLKSDGTISTLFQGAGVVYSWDGASTFTSVGTCNAASKLRGDWRSHNWMLDDKLLLTDLTLNDVVKEWNGTTFASVGFTDESGAPFGTFYAKYLTINNERALFANIRDPSDRFPHLMVGSAQSVYTQITTTNRPSSAMSTSDPFYLVTPDLRPVNGLVQAFATNIISTEKGRLFNLSGESAKDFAFVDFFAGSAASGEESLVYIGNDVIYGRQGRVESVRDTQSFGNSESDDISLPIADQFEENTSWTNVFNGRNNRVYMFPSGQSEVWVLNTAIRTSRQLQANALDQFVFQSTVQKAAGKLSPWMKWTTQHAIAWQPTFVYSMLDPGDGLEYVFMGDSAGHVYRVEGTGANGDGGTTNISTAWTSRVFSAPLDADVYEVEGFIKYKKNQACSVLITLLAAGQTAFDQVITVQLPSAGAFYWGSSHYWGGHNYWGALFRDRLIRQRFDIPGQMSDFQVKVEVVGNTDFEINEIHLRFKVASQ